MSPSVVVAWMVRAGVPPVLVRVLRIRPSVVPACQFHVAALAGVRGPDLDGGVVPAGLHRVLLCWLAVCHGSTIPAGPVTPPPRP